MKIGIICASDSEIAPFLSMSDRFEVTEKAMLKFFSGKIGNTDVVTLFSGVGKVNAAIAAQILADTFKCGAIINSGTAGSMSDGVKIFDTVVSTEVVYHDMDEDILTEFHPYIPSCFFKSDRRLIDAARAVLRETQGSHSILFGRMATGDRFIKDETTKAQIKALYAPLSIDMETASIAHVCYVNNIPFISVRTITDNANDGGSENFEENCDKASRIAAEFVRNMLAKLPPDIYKDIG